jgi:AAA15 family ATPase/GTPase
MFTEVQIENYKSIQNLKIGLGRVNVFIGENGCGKSNILEAIALAGAAAGNKLDNEFLAPRGIRVTEPEFMRSAFDKENVTKEIIVNIKTSEANVFNCVIQHSNLPYASWTNVNPATLKTSAKNSLFNDILKDKTRDEALDYLVQIIEEKVGEHLKKTDSESLHQWLNKVVLEMPSNMRDNIFDYRELVSFLVYSPENSSLRIFESEWQIEPMGIKGEGLLKLLKVLNGNLEKSNEIKQKLELIDWFDDFKIHQVSDIERTIQIKDRYLDKELPYFNQRSSNEGFLFLMFYFALFVSDDTPKFFAIDNIENALNPKLCTRLIQELVELAKKYDKQVIFTTHNPAVLDGLDLSDDEQRLFVIYRNVDGHTKARRISAPEPLEDDDPVQLSEAFINGYLGGLPNNF